MTLLALWCRELDMSDNFLTGDLNPLLSAPAIGSLKADSNLLDALFELDIKRADTLVCVPASCLRSRGVPTNVVTVAAR